MENFKQKILLPIDFIIDSEHLLDYAIQLGLTLDFDIYMLHVSDPEQSEVYYTQGIQPEVTFTNIQSRIDEAKKTMQTLKDKAQKKYEKTPEITFSASIGFVTSELLDKIEETNIGLILSSKKEETDFLNALEGSLNKTIIEKSNIPVMVINEGKEYKPLQKIIYATDFIKEDIATLRKIAILLQAFQPEIIAVHVSEDVSFDAKIKTLGFQRMIKEQVGYHKLKLIHYLGEDTPETINRFANHENADMIVMLKENRTFWEKIFSKSTTKKIVDITEKPLLVFHE